MPWVHNIHSHFHIRLRKELVQINVKYVSDFRVFKQPMTMTNQMCYLCGVNVTSWPSHWGPECNQSLDQHLGKQNKHVKTRQHRSIRQSSYDTKYQAKWTNSEIITRQNPSNVHQITHNCHFNFLQWAFSGENPQIWQINPSGESP